ncbi:carboxypeptidase-like regulatory domain-containing protein [Pelagicoccus mobilis]|uniref:Carboxypeptidase regulatory-like domain-containing protein n=1 Tax=Pelagicoccus mobilis TaxID=415221 RepID=A0A934VJ81_9BACT|nr:carboxypeptidase-like regulatory domain-containing protein [Pelagicoccus mobilis]MBK1875331.1 carboxypeptidase regulatory-like domain-containing protein [Pelagicoccus mobilis]
MKLASASLLFVLFNLSLWSTPTDLSLDISSASIELSATEITPSPSPEELLAVAITDKRNLFPSVKIPLALEQQDLSRHHYLDTTIVNTGDAPLKITFWAVGEVTWDPAAGTVELAPGESKVCSVDLWQSWPGGLMSKCDPSKITHIQFTVDRPKAFGSYTIGRITLRGQPPSERPDFSAANRLSVPPMIDSAPAPGKRVRQKLPSFENTSIYHSLYLPNDWQPGKRYPIIVEYAGNRWLTSKVYSPGTPEGSRMGYGMSEGDGYIWVNAPYVNADLKTQALNGWGDADATADYAVELVKMLCEDFGGDHSSVIITGFSRGAVAAGFIGLRNKQISDVWLGFHACQHYDGDGIGGADYDSALSIRGPRKAGRATFHTDNTQHQELHKLFERLQFPVTFADSKLRAHTDTMFLEDRPSTLLLRQWLADTIANKPGTASISGRVSKKNGKPLPNVRIQSGDTHFTYTDKNGDYLLEGLVTGKRNVSATLKNWTANQTIVLESNGTTGLNFKI